MMRNRKHFRGHVLSLRKHAIKVPICFFLGLLLICLGLSILPNLSIPSSFLANCINRTVLAFGAPQITTIRISTYDLLENSILSIKASETMSKKYAAKYGGIMKTELSKKANEKKSVDPFVETNIATNGLTFINTPAVSVDAQALLTTPLTFPPQDGSPRVLIVHTHTSEAYSDSPDSRSEDPAHNVVSVGNEIKNALTAAGIGVIHDTTQNDNPSYNQSYKKALTVIEKNLATYPTIDVVLDIHRDYIKRDDGTLVKPTITTKSGEKAAQIMFVMGTDSMGLYHPDWRHNLAFAAQIQHKLQVAEPELCRSINIRTERFNQHATKGSMIIEVGTGENTLAEARCAGKLVGKAIAEVLLAQ